MPTPKRGPRLGAGPAHQRQLLANLASDLFRHGQVRTTLAKAKTLRPYAERLITKAKQGDLPARRQVIAKLRDRDVVAYLFEEVAPRFADRNGGYTRILKLGPRKGDNAPMALIELVEQGAEHGDEVIEESKLGRSRGLFGRRRRRQEAPAAAGSVLLDELEEFEDTFDVDDDEQVAAAVREATGTGGDEADEAEAEADDDADTQPAAESDDSDGDAEAEADDDAADDDEDAKGS